MAPQPQMRGYGIQPNNMAAQYQQYNSQLGGHAPHLPPPGNPSFMTQNSSQNPFNQSINLSQGFGGNGGGNIAGGIGLASHDAQRLFHGGNMQPQSTGGSMYEGSRPGNKTNKAKIREVWKGNLVEEFEVLRKLIDQFPYISMHTQFPGLVARPMGAFRNKSDYHYQTLRSNVDLLKLIQLGITLFDEDGRLVPERPQSSESAIDMDFTSNRNTKSRGQYCTWQFNFQFSLTEDMYSESAINSLRLAGADFQKHEQEGIDIFAFGALLMSSGLVCFEDVTWISFHGGYDFGYLSKLLTREPMPEDESEWHMILKKLFPSAYDVKYLMKHAIRSQAMNQLASPQDPAANEVLQKFDQKSNLDSLSDAFRVERLGRAHNAGSDSYVTGKCFFEMQRRIYNNDIPTEIVNKVWGLGLPEASTSGLTFSHSQVPGTQYAGHAHENPIPGTQNGGHGDPSTPISNHVGLANTLSSAHGTLTPGGVTGGQFGQFRYGGGGS